MRRAVLVVVLGIALFCVAPPLFALRTDALSHQIGKALSEKASAATGFEVSIGNARLYVPGMVKLQQVEVRDHGELIAYSEEIRVGITLRTLFAKQIGIRFIESDAIEVWSSDGAGVAPPIPEEWPNLPWGVAIGEIEIEALHLHSSETTQTWSIRGGSVDIQADGGDFQARLALLSPDRAEWLTSIQGNAESQEVRLDLEGSNLNETVQWDGLALDTLVGRATATLEQWHMAIHGNGSKDPLVEGDLSLSMATPNRNTPSYNILGKHAQANATYYLDGRQILHLTHIEIDAASAMVSGSGAITSRLEIVNGQFVGDLFELSSLTTDSNPRLKGALHFDGEVWGSITSPSVTLRFTSDLLIADRTPIYQPRGEITAKPGDEGWRGTFFMEGSTGEVAMRLSFNYAQGDEKCWLFEPIRLSSQQLQLGGSLRICEDRELWSGHLAGEVRSLAVLALPLRTELEGRGTLRLDLTPREGATPQQLILKVDGRYVTFDEYKAERLELDLQVLNPLVGIPAGRISAEAEHLLLGALLFSEVKAELLPSIGAWDYRLEALGEDIENRIALRGTYTPAARRTTWTLDHLQAVIETLPIDLQQPATLTLEKEGGYHLTPLRIAFGEGTASLQMEVTREESQVLGQVRNLPLQLAEWIRPEWKLEGVVSGEAAFQDRGKGVEGAAHLAWQGALPKMLSRGTVLPLEGAANLSIKEDRASLRLLSSSSNAKEPLEMDLSLPLSIDLLPFTVSLEPEAAIQGRVGYQGRIGPITRALLFKEALIEGALQMDLQLAGTVSTPEIYGSLELEKGAYDNLRTGTTLRNLEGQLLGRGSSLELTALTATDGNNGNLLGAGTLSLYWQQNLPFETRIALRNATLLQNEGATATFSGELTVDGSLAQPKASGNLTINSAALSIPDRLPPSIPSLPVVYVNLPQEVQAIEERALTEGTPMILDLNLRVQQTVLSGRGLTSLWEGNLTIGGTTENPEIHGSLEMERGRFDFSDRTFNLVKGTIAFDGDLDTGTVELVATIKSNGIEIIATLSGPLSDPSLSLRSIPPLSQREILSYVLFDAPIDEIGPFQALSLAAAARVLAGGKMIPNPLQVIRKRLGLDHLTVVRPDEATDEIGIEAGRRFGKNAYLTLYRSLREQYNHMLIELELYDQWQLYVELQDTEGETVGIRWKKDY